MLQGLLISSYRVAAIIAVLTPVVANITLQGDLLTSLIYAPIASLILAALFIYFDKSLVSTVSIYTRLLRQKRSAKTHPLRSYSTVKNSWTCREKTLCPWC